MIDATLHVAAANTAHEQAMNDLVHGVCDILADQAAAVAFGALRMGSWSQIVCHGHKIFKALNALDDADRALAYADLTGLPDEEPREGSET
jgi:hypothetical protein